MEIYDRVNAHFIKIIMLNRQTHTQTQTNTYTQKPIIDSESAYTSSDTPTYTTSVDSIGFVSHLPGVIGVFFFPNQPSRSDFDSIPSYDGISTSTIVETGLEITSGPDPINMNHVLHTCIESVETLLYRQSNETLFVLLNDKTAIGAVSEVLQAFFLSQSKVNEAEDNSNIINLPLGANDSPKTLQQTRYTGADLIGEGGTAYVYKAYDTRMQREVALKRYKDDSSWNTEENYKAELETAARIHHHNVVVSHDANHDEKGSFIVMEYIDGVDLETKLKDAPMSQEAFCDFAVQALEGLSATHQGGLLHLDIKPSNIMLAREGGTREHVKLIDFGQARAAKDPKDGGLPKGLGLSGSVYFASPEYLREYYLDVRSDIYSLGCTFYWALSGKFPFGGHDALSVMCSHLQHKVRHLHELAPHLPRRLTNWVMLLISANCERRPSTANDALDMFFRRRLANIHAPS